MVSAVNTLANLKAAEDINPVLFPNLRKVNLLNEHGERLLHSLTESGVKPKP
jgi:hypothetical protein